MQSKNLIFTADDLGNNSQINSGILAGIKNGLITSTCLMANGPAFDEAVEEILPQCIDTGIGVHLDIIENYSLLNKNSKSLLCDVSGKYNNSYQMLLAKSYNSNFMAEVEAEFRSQIEKILYVVKPDHINSHVHTHAIPRIFELTCRLAKEYGIKCVRTQYEKGFFVPSKSFCAPFALNMVKNVLLNYFSLINKKTVQKYDLLTNDNFIGVKYTGMMDALSVSAGLNTVKDGEVSEILVHPYFYEQVNNENKNRYGEYLLAVDSEFKKHVIQMNFNLIKFEDLYKIHASVNPAINNC